MLNDIDKHAANPWIAAAIGSALSLKFMPGLGWGERAANAGITYGCGVVLGGAMVDYLGLTSGKSAAGVVLLTSALSLVLFQIVLDSLRATAWAGMLTEWLRKRLGLDKEGA